MALARIITRSQACSRELAIDLLARGYAVEIVSPDEIPDNLADLELRVEEDPGNQLVATVETHNGERSASLNFVHHLRAPMAEFVRRFPEPQGSNAPSEPSILVSTDPTLSIFELKGDPPPGMNFVSQPAAVLRRLDVKPEDIRENDAPSIIMSEPTPLLPADLPVHAPVDLAPMTGQAPVSNITLPKIVPPLVVAAKRISQFARLSQKRIRAAGWLWSAGLTSTGIVILALILGFGLHRNEKNSNSANNIAAAPPNVSAMMQENQAADLSQVKAPTALVQRTDRQTAATAPSVVANPTSFVVRLKSRANSESKHDADVVARDTVIYLDKRFTPQATKAPIAKPRKAVASHHPIARRRRSAVIAANKVTYLDKPMQKATK